MSLARARSESFAEPLHGNSNRGHGEPGSEVAVSPALPMLPLHEIPRWLERAETAGETAMMAEFLEWVRAELAPRQAPE